ncbi:MAG TPA: hypothetical protein PLC99_14995 [Verrucomicrobiota bacterium]|nr:hypothetical protein [Verrucomicrobiota bacterium]
MKLVTIKLTSDEFEVLNQELRGFLTNAAVKQIGQRTEFARLFGSALPITAISQPEVQKGIRQADLIWAFDSANNNQGSLVEGREMLGYSFTRLFPRRLAMLGFKYESPYEFLKLTSAVSGLRKLFGNRWPN